jgi:hypothetical protein
MSRRARTENPRVVSIRLGRISKLAQPRTFVKDDFLGTAWKHALGTIDSQSVFGDEITPIQ